MVPAEREHQSSGSGPYLRSRAGSQIRQREQVAARGGDDVTEHSGDRGRLEVDGAEPGGSQRDLLQLVAAASWLLPCRRDMAP
jgi:hypothetical protein